MSRWDGDSLPVCDGNRRLVGAISMRAVCLHANATGKRLADMQVDEVAEQDTPICRPEDRAPDLILRMSETSRWSLPMVDRDRVLIGMVGFRKLLQSLQDDTDTIRIESAAESDAAPLSTRNPRNMWRLLQQSRQLESPIGDRRHLTYGELKLLLAFVESAGKVLGRDSLMRSVCNRDWDPLDRYVDVLVGNLRGKFGERASNARAIVTIKNEGYLFTLKVQATQPSMESIPSATRWVQRPRAVGTRNALLEKVESTRPQPSPSFLEEVNHLYEDRGEAEARGFCIEHRVIASICMTCSRLYRVVESQGPSGGLSHGWCSRRCAQHGTERASVR
jgi:DNA-binding winged helix-turn-helix (wHTH) protein